MQLLLSREHHQGLVRVLKYTLAFVNPNLSVTLGQDGFDILTDLFLFVRRKNGSVALAQGAVDTNLL